MSTGDPYVVVVQEYERSRPIKSTVEVSRHPSLVKARAARDTWTRHRLAGNGNPEGAIYRTARGAEVRIGNQGVVAVAWVEDRRPRPYGAERWGVEVRGDLLVKTRTKAQALKLLYREVEKWRSHATGRHTAISNGKNGRQVECYFLKDRGVWAGEAKLVPLRGRR